MSSSLHAYSNDVPEPDSGSGEAASGYMLLTPEIETLMSRIDSVRAELETVRNADLPQDLRMTRSVGLVTEIATLKREMIRTQRMIVLGR